MRGYGGYCGIWGDMGGYGANGARWDPRAHMGPSGRALHGSHGPIWALMELISYLRASSTNTTTTTMI